MQEALPWLDRVRANGAADLTLALILFLVAFCASLQFDELPVGQTLLIFFLAVTLAAAFCSVATASLVVLLSAAATAWLIEQADAAGGSGVAGSFAAVGLFIVVSAVEIALMASLHTLRRTVAEQARESARRLDLAVLFNREQQHRIANGLQMVGGLLLLEGRSRDDATRETFERAARRLSLLRKIDDRIGEAGGDRIDAAALIEAVARDLVDAAAPAGIGCTVQAETLLLGREQSLPLAMIVTELLANALKHAYPAGRRGTVAIRLWSEGPTRAVLEVRDDGVGIPSGLDPARPGGLGVGILRALAAQLAGELTFAGDGGTAARFAFPIPAPTMPFAPGPIPGRVADLG